MATMSIPGPVTRFRLARTRSRAPWAVAEALNGRPGGLPAAKHEHGSPEAADDDDERQQGDRGAALHLAAGAEWRHRRFRVDRAGRASWMRSRPR